MPTVKRTSKEIHENRGRVDAKKLAPLTEADIERFAREDDSDTTELGEPRYVPPRTDVRALRERLGDAYTEDFLLDSLTSHVSIVHLKDFPSGVNADGSLQFDTAATRDFVDRYLLKTIRRILEITLLVSVALGTKDALVSILTEFDGRIGPIFDRYNAG